MGDQWKHWPSSGKVDKVSLKKNVLQQAALIIQQQRFHQTLYLSMHQVYS